ncbi:MAG: 50S ribosomal protein L18 [Gammaproteobacteria bacterium]
MDKKRARMRRTRKPRKQIQARGGYRLCVHRTLQHIYAQIIDSEAGSVVTSASTLDKSVKGEVSYGGNIVAASAVGKAIAERARDKGVETVAFDRSGFRYHGRVKALAEAAREGGLQFSPDPRCRSHINAQLRPNLYYTNSEPI